MQLAEFVEVPLDDRTRKIQLGQIILIDQDDTSPLLRNVYPREVYPDLKARDPKLSRTLNPPFGKPMFKEDVELNKWLRNEMQKQAGRTNTTTPQATTQGSNGSHHRG